MTKTSNIGSTHAPAIIKGWVRGISAVGPADGAAVNWIPITPTQLAANTDNWNPTDLATAAIIRASTDASRNLTGIVAPSPADERLLILENVGSFNLVLKHDVTSTAANRFYLPNGADTTVGPGSTALLLYDTTSARWRLLRIAGSAAAAAEDVTYDNATSGLTATDVQAAIDEVAAAVESGVELDYVQITSGVNVTATTEAGADTIVTGSAVAYDGSTIILIEFYAFSARPRTDAAGALSLWLYDGSSSIGRIGVFTGPAAAASNKPAYVARRLTPSAATHTYSIRASVGAGTGNVGAGAGGSTADMPAFIRITKV